MITEINRSKFSVGQIHFQHPEKKPLTPLVVIRITGNDLIFPGEHISHRTKLETHPLNVFVGPVLGMDVVFDCSVFCWKTECIETNRKKHLIPMHLQKIRSLPKIFATWLQFLQGRILPSFIQLFIPFRMESFGFVVDMCSRAPKRKKAGLRIFEACPIFV